MTRFEIAYEITRANEGGYHGGTGVNAADRGGETFKGIARKIWPAWAGWPVIDRMKQSTDFPMNALTDPVLGNMVRMFFKSNFWDVNRLSEIQSQAVANELFDSGVNCGARLAARWLQKSLNYLNRGGQTWDDLKMDGIIGRRTVNTFNSRTAVDKVAVFNIINILQGKHYLDLIDRDSSQETFLRGWITRVELMQS